jgi:hypothetical protein
MHRRRLSRFTLAAAALWVTGTALRPAPAPGAVPRFELDAAAAPAAPEVGYFQMGTAGAGRTPDGRVLAINSRHLVLDGRPWFPVMGEFHYSRYPEQEWEDEILKMKAGGVQVIATYIFWLHHEEIEGRFDWSGRRDLRRFVTLCGRHGLRVWARIGPWSHGEARNGGLPDWLLAQGPTRVNDPGYLEHVRTFYGEIGHQLRGLLWKDGGPVVGVQLENEYHNRSPQGGAAHITTLQQLALAAGLDVPVYTVTGWDNTVYPPRIVTPVFGGYPDEPWSGSRDELPPDRQGVYQFAPIGGNTGILQGVTTPAPDVQLSSYPRFTAELGAGMQVTYHRRVVVAPEDVPPIAISALGSGVTLLGYYMYHGGINPDGKLTPLQESQATRYPNDVPVKSYDFQAPLGAYGQPAPTYRKLKVIHQFLADFGAELATMPRVLPGTVPTGLSDVTTLRVAGRTDGERGFIFINNFVRHHPMPDQPGVQVSVKFASGTVLIPREPVTVPSQSSFFWPVNLDLGGVRLRYATAQPLAKLSAPEADYWFFVSIAGIAPEFAVVAPVDAVTTAHGAIVSEKGGVVVRSLSASTDVAWETRGSHGRPVRVLLLSPEQAENTWKVTTAAGERMVLTDADVFAEGDTLHFRSGTSASFTCATLPACDAAGSPWRRDGRDGVFARYRAAVPARAFTVKSEKLRDAAVVGPVKLGEPAAWRRTPVALAPDEAAFGSAAGRWRVTVPEKGGAGVHDVFLVVRYAGDVGRLSSGDRLLDDNFYNGTPWWIGVNELGLAAGEEVQLSVLPLRRDAPIYLPKERWPDFGHRAQIAEVLSVDAVPEYEVTLTVPPGS